MEYRNQLYQDQLRLQRENVAQRKITEVFPEIQHLHIDLDAKLGELTNLRADATSSTYSDGGFATA